MRVQVQVLKQEVRDLNEQIRRQQVPPEYLKEVVVRYILSSPVSSISSSIHSRAHALSFFSSFLLPLPAVRLVFITPAPYPPFTQTCKTL
jgi:hypothetical protein